jgi:hypothetical protein
MNLKSLATLFAPLLTEVWTDYLYPEIQALENQIGSADVKTVATAVAGALNTIVGSEIAKL